MVTIKNHEKISKKLIMKRKRFWFLDLWKSRVSEKSLLPKNCPEVCDHLFPFPFERHEWITPYVKTYCQYNIVQHSNIQMSKNLAATGSKSIKWKKSNQISYLLLNLCHLTKIELVFFQVSLLKVKTCLNRRQLIETICLWQKNLAALSHKIRIKCTRGKIIKIS